jgi:hypothetical protein
MTSEGATRFLVTAYNKCGLLNVTVQVNSSGTLNDENALSMEPLLKALMKSSPESETSFSYITIVACAILLIAIALLLIVAVLMKLAAVG